jgi:hypothetical protein
MERVDKLKERSDHANSWTEEDTAEWEALDGMIAQGQWAAEK